jgi:hypothetical protein
MVEGVLLYPRKGISKNVIEQEVQDWISEQHSVGHGSLNIHQVTQRDTNWAIVYSIDAWYNHFDLQEEYN